MNNIPLNEMTEFVHEHIRSRLLHQFESPPRAHIPKETRGRMIVLNKTDSTGQTDPNPNQLNRGCIYY